MLYSLFDVTESLRHRLVLSGVATILVKAAGVMSAFALSVVLARTLGPRHYGLYTYTMTIVTLLVVPCQLGLPNLLTREIAAIDVSQRTGIIKGFVVWSVAVVALGTALITAIGLVSASWLLDAATNSRHILWYGLPLIPLLALSGLFGPMLAGMKRVALGLLPENLVRPLLLALLLLVTSALSGDAVLSAHDAIQLAWLSAGLTIVFGVALLIGTHREVFVGSQEPHYRPSHWLASGAYLMVLSCVFLANQSVDIIVLGSIVDASEVAHYKVAAQVALVVGFGLQAVNLSISPHLAEAYAKGEHALLQRLVTAAARVSILLAAPVAGVILVYGDLLILWIFGDQYADKESVLVVLVLGKVVGAAMGPVNRIFLMAGGERQVLAITVLVLIANVVASFALVDRFGAFGAAIATAGALVLWNVLLSISIYRTLKIVSLPLAVRGLRR